MNTFLQIVIFSFIFTSATCLTAQLSAFYNAKVNNANGYFLFSENLT